MPKFKQRFRVTGQKRPRQNAPVDKLMKKVIKLAYKNNFLYGSTFFFLKTFLAEEI